MENKELTLLEVLNLAVEKQKGGKLDEAEILYKKILEKYPSSSDAFHLLGLIEYEKGEYEKAVENIDKAIQLNPEAVFYGNLGMCYDKLGDEEKSAECFLKALGIDFEYKKAYLANYNLGIYFKEKGEIEKALGYYDEAIRLNDDFSDAHWNRGLVLLLLGKFEEGWKEYEYRMKKESPVDSRIFDKPKWDGSVLNGKKIFVVSEQGFGDNLQFVRYLSLIKERRGYVILECRKELINLFRSLKMVDEFVEKKNDFFDVDYDFYIHLMSLPRVFNTNLENIPNEVPYLKADSELVEKFKSKFDKDKLKIGIVWSGNEKQDDNDNRSMKFENFKSLIEMEGVQLFSLQKGEPAKQLDDENVVDIGKDINDFADTAAVIENLDLIISVDTATAHLAGAMGKPVWVLLTKIPDWRWLLDRGDCPWYPTMKLFRQKNLGDWDEVVERVGVELGGK